MNIENKDEGGKAEGKDISDGARMDKNWKVGVSWLSSGGLQYRMSREGRTT